MVKFEVLSSHQTPAAGFPNEAGRVPTEVESEESSFTDADMARLREAYKISDSVRIRAPSKDERASDFFPGEVCMYEHAFAIGLRFPIPPIIRQILSHYNLAPAQLVPNCWRILLGCIDLWNASTGRPMTVKEFTYYYQIVSHNGLRFYFSSRDKRSKLNIPLPSSNKNWKNKFFLVSGKGWEFGPEENTLGAIRVPRQWGSPKEENMKAPTMSNSDLALLKVVEKEEEEEGHCARRLEKAAKARCRDKLNCTPKKKLKKLDKPITKAQAVSNPIKIKEQPSKEATVVDNCGDLQSCSSCSDEGITGWSCEDGVVTLKDESGSEMRLDPNTLFAGVLREEYRAKLLCIFKLKPDTFMHDGKLSSLSSLPFVMETFGGLLERFERTELNKASQAEFDLLLSMLGGLKPLLPRVEWLEDRVRKMAAQARSHTLDLELKLVNAKMVALEEKMIELEEKKRKLLQEARELELQPQGHFDISGNVAQGLF